MRIAYNPSTEPLASAPQNNDITIDLAGKTIYARGVKVGGASYGVFQKHTSTSGGGYDGLVPAPPYVTTTTTRYLTDTGEWKTLNFVDTYNKTEIDDLISGAKTYTDTKIANLVNGAPETLDTLKEISDYLQDSTVVGGLLDQFKKYLPLSGGTLILEDRGSFSVKRNKGAGYGAYIQYENSEEILGHLGLYKASDNTYAADIYFGDGSNHQLIHSGNIGSQSVASASKLSTARTIWGQSFDGSGNVSGDLSGVGSITRSFQYAVDSDIAGNVKFKRNDTVWKFYNSSSNPIVAINGNSNNVMIGTDAYSGNAKLYVGENGTIFVESKNDIDTRTVGSNNGASVSVNATDTGWLGSGGEMRFCLGGGTVVGVIKGKYTTWNQQFNPTTFGSLSFYTRDTTTGNLTERMIIRDNGKVGIGTTDPTTKLHVVGSALFTDTLTINADKENPALKIFNTNGGFHLYSGFTENEPFRIDACNDKGVYTNNILTAKQDSETKQVDVNFYGNVFSKNIYRVTEKEITLKLTQTWQDTGIQFNDSSLFPSSGTYVVQVYINAGSTEGFWYSYFSGIMSVYTDYTNADVPDDEIILHHSSHANKHHIYLKTKPTLGGNETYNKLYIACNKDFTAARNIQFKFKKLI